MLIICISSKWSPFFPIVNMELLVCYCYKKSKTATNVCGCEQERTRRKRRKYLTFVRWKWRLIINWRAFLGEIRESYKVSDFIKIVSLPFLWFRVHILTYTHGEKNSDAFKKQHNTFTKRYHIHNYHP